MDPIKLEERRKYADKKKKEDKMKLGSELKILLDDMKSDIARQVRIKRAGKEISKYYISKNGCAITQIIAIESGKTNYTMNSFLSYINTLGLKIVLVDK